LAKVSRQAPCLLQAEERPWPLGPMSKPAAAREKQKAARAGARSRAPRPAWLARHSKVQIVPPKETDLEPPGLAWG
jgi:hypothetical protein